MYFRPAFFMLAFFLLFPAFSPGAYAFSLSVRPDTVAQGDAFLVIVSTGPANREMPRAGFSDRKVPLRRVGSGLYMGLASASSRLSAGTYNVEASLAGVGKFIPVNVKKKEFPVDRISLPPGKVSLSPENEKRADREAARLSKIWPLDSASRWGRDFIMPLKGRPGTGFGARRILNGIEKSPHNGIDVKAGRGTPVGAVNGGAVVLADDLFFGGNTIVLDHGEGLYSFYMHLDGFAVKKGSRVERGDVIGYVGSTGRSTGPHLHMGMKLRGTNVNPLSIIELEVDEAIKEKK